MRILFIFLWLITTSISAQELNCLVSVNTQQVNQTNQQIFKTLEKSLQEFVNRTQWTSLKVLPNEKIESSITFTITNYENNRFVADIQLQATRPVFASVYQTNLLNYRERNVKFSYMENEPLYFNANTFTSDLTSAIAFYVYIIIGLDADSFSLFGGTPYYRQALSVVQNAQISGDTVWQQTGKNNRWQLVTDLLSNQYITYREVLYQYHRLGIDKLTSDETSKQEIANSLLQLQKLKSGQLNNFMLQLFFDAKTDEIVNLFSEGNPISNSSELKNILTSLSPLQAEKWQKIK